MALLLAVLWLTSIAPTPAALAQASPTDATRAREQFAAAFMVEAQALAKTPGTHPRLIHAFLVDRGFQPVPSDFMARAVMGWTLRRPFQTIYFAADGTGRFRTFKTTSNDGWVRDFTWWRTPDGLCLELAVQRGQPSRICLQFYRFETLQVALLINPPGLPQGPGPIRFLKGDLTGEESWGKIAVMQ